LELGNGLYQVRFADKPNCNLISFSFLGTGEIVFLYIPMGLLTLMNTGFFVASYRKLQKSNNSFSKDKDTRCHSTKENEGIEK
jgi:hypothetical protein